MSLPKARSNANTAMPSLDQMLIEVVVLSETGEETFRSVPAVEFLKTNAAPFSVSPAH